MYTDPVLGYIHGPMRRVDGWFTRLDAEITATIARHQADLKLTGSVGEIGVHHGRMFVVLALAMKEGERAFAIDIFGDQHLNQDRSGHGDETVFRGNLVRHGIDVESRVAIIRGSSLNVDWTDVEAQVGARARLFSIDGGHTRPPSSRTTWRSPTPGWTRRASLSPTTTSTRASPACPKARRVSCCAIRMRSARSPSATAACSCAARNGSSDIGRPWTPAAREAPGGDRADVGQRRLGLSDAAPADRPGARAPGHASCPRPPARRAAQALYTPAADGLTAAAASA